MQPVISISGNDILFSNGSFSRHLVFDDNGLVMDSLVNRITGTEYCKEPQLEFSATANGRGISSHSIRKDGDDWYSITPFGSHDGLQLVIRFTVADAPLKGRLLYHVSGTVGGYVKRLELEATDTDTETVLEALYLERLCFCAGEFADNDVSYGTDDLPAPIVWVAEGTTDIMTVFNRKQNEGWLCATGIPGALRRFMWYPHWHSAGVSYAFGAAPFKLFLKPHETFTSDSTYFGVFSGDSSNELLRQLVRDELPPLPAPEGVMYCTWLPFLRNINESLVTDMAQRAARMGFDYLVLDDGWFTNDNRAVDRDKFPNGLETVSQCVRDNGLKFGLWLSIGTAYGLNPVPEAYAALHEDGTAKKLDGRTVLCWASDYRDRLIEELSALAETYHVSYFKLDFSAITSPYQVMAYGCHAHHHAHHHGFEDSFIEMYRGLDAIRNELKKRFPPLLIDYSFEAFGTDRPNIAALERCELHHTSNYSGQKPEYQDIAKIRQIYYRWFAKLPPERILGGLLVLQNERAAEYFLTSLCGAPLVAGDLSKLDDALLARLKAFTAAFKSQTAHNVLGKLEILENNDNFDAFVRRGDNGHGFLCAFNRTDAPYKVDYPLELTNVENGQNDIWIAPHQCAMFSF